MKSRLLDELMTSMLLVEEAVGVLNEALVVREYRSLDKEFSANLARVFHDASNTLAMLEQTIKRLKVTGNLEPVSNFEEVGEEKLCSLLQRNINRLESRKNFREWKKRMGHSHPADPLGAGADLLVLDENGKVVGEINGNSCCEAVPSYWPYKKDGELSKNYSIIASRKSFTYIRKDEA